MEPFKISGTAGLLDRSFMLQGFIDSECLLMVEHPFYLMAKPKIAFHIAAAAAPTSICMCVTFILLILDA